MIKKCMYIGLMVLGLVTSSMAADGEYFGYGGPFTTLSTIDDEYVLQYGIFGGSLYGDFLVGGIAAVGSEFSHAGGYFGFRIAEFDQFTIVSNVALGYGVLSDSNEQFSLVEPGIHMEFSLSDYKKLFVGINYRMTDSSTDIDGASVSMGFKYGQF